MPLTQVDHVGRFKDRCNFIEAFCGILFLDIDELLFGTRYHGLVCNIVGNKVGDFIDPFKRKSRVLQQGFGLGKEKKLENSVQVYLIKIMSIHQLVKRTTPGPLVARPPASRISG